MHGRAARFVMVMCVALGVATAPSGAQAQTGPTLPPGFQATVRAQGLVTPTAMAIGPDGRLYVAQQNGLIRAVGANGIVTIASGFTVPLGLAWHKKQLYVSWTGAISTLTPSRNYRSFTRRTIVGGLPTGVHQNDSLAFRGGWMYVGIGSTCNACAEADRRSASIMRFRPNGSGGQIYAKGLRNPFGLAFRPGTGGLYATDNGRDDFGDSVPDEFNRIQRGGNYGWPNCWGRGGGSGCAGTIAPRALFEPHASADGFAFYTGRTFPARYRGDAFVTEFGQTVGVGYNGHRVKDVHFAGNGITVTDFATGLSHPVSAMVGRDGSLLVADYGTGIIWRIQVAGR